MERQGERISTSIDTGLAGTRGRHEGRSDGLLATALAEELLALVYHVDSLALASARTNEDTLVGEEARGRMVERMHGMMGGM